MCPLPPSSGLFQLSEHNGQQVIPPKKQKRVHSVAVFQILQEKWCDNI